MDVIQELYPNDKHNHKERAEMLKAEAKPERAESVA
jgi:hypothetical protein